MTDGIDEKRALAQSTVKSLRAKAQHRSLDESQIERLRAVGFAFSGEIRASLAEARPDVADLWHPDKNGGLTPKDVTVGSERIVSWRHWHKGSRSWHEWQAKVVVQVDRERPCPYCAGRKLLVGFNDLATVRPDVAAEWHPDKNGSLMPNDVLAGSSRKAWWKCSVDGTEWLQQVYKRALSEKLVGCPLCGKRRRYTAKAKPVECVETGERYVSLSAAGRAMGANHGQSVSECAAGKAKTAYGYHWRYVDDDDLNSRSSERGLMLVEEPARTVRRGERPSTPVRCVDTGEVFKGVTACAKLLGVTQGAVRHSIGKGTVCCGLRFDYVPEYDGPFDDASTSIAVQMAKGIKDRGKLSGVRCPVRDLDTGEVYPAIAAAARALGVASPSVQRALRSGGRAGGHRLARLDPRPPKEDEQ